MFKKLLMTTALSIPLAFNGAASAQTPAKRPNIVVIMADDVGIWNISAYHRGMMGGSTPNIDRIAREGALFTDYYAQQSCTAGRADDGMIQVALAPRGRSAAAWRDSPAPRWRD